MPFGKDGNDAVTVSDAITVAVVVTIVVERVPAEGSVDATIFDLAVMGILDEVVSNSDVNADAVADAVAGVGFDKGPSFPDLVDPDIVGEALPLEFPFPFPFPFPPHNV